MLILGNCVGEVQGLRKSKITGGSEYPENGSSHKFLVGNLTSSSVRELNIEVVSKQKQSLGIQSFIKVRLMGVKL